MDRNTLKYIALLSAGACMSSANADVTPSIDVKEKFTDNVYYQNHNEQDSWITTVTPGVTVKMNQGANKYELGASTEAGYYSVDSRNDYTDWLAYGKAGLEFDSKNHFDVRAGWTHGHDDIGTGRTEGDLRTLPFAMPSHPDEYDKTDLDVKYTFGAKDSRGKLVLRDIYSEQNYTNNERPVAFGTDPQDTAENEVRETAYLKVMPKTSVLLEARQKNITYDHSYNALTAQGAGPTMDSDETKVYVGAEWEATAKTTGAIRLGHLDKDFVEPNGVVSHPDSYSIPSWESDITWRPRTYSNFVLSTARGFVDSANTGSVIDETRLSLTWNHEWSSVIGSKVYALRLQDDYKSPAINEREDTVTKLGAGTYYKLNKRAKLYADYVFTDRDSNENRFDYNRNLFIIGAKVDFN